LSSVTGFRVQQVFQFGAFSGDEQLSGCRCHPRPPELANGSARLADLGSKLRDFQGRGSSTATLGALDRFRVQGPIVCLQSLFDVEHSLITAKGIPLANEGDHLSPHVHQPAARFRAIFVLVDLSAD